jgi:tetratricopeptide (TPR) repeat protein
MHLRHLIIIFSIMLATSSSFADEKTVFDADDNFHQGQIFYENDNFAAAEDSFSKAISQSPDDSRYHHWMAKTYGELAETSGWLKAMRFAENAKKSLERAVELDPKNAAALTDLMEYYKQAPRFLGGSDKKAEEISNRLEKLKGKNTRTFINHHVNSSTQNS